MLKPLFGGRVAHPLQSWTQGTSFNSDLLGAELLLADDEVALRSNAARRELAQAVKSALFGESVRIHPKGAEAFSCRPAWRAVFLVNDDADHLTVIPEIDETLEDKIALFRCGRAELPFRPETPEDRERLARAVAAELPAFAASVLAHQIRAENRHDRTGIKSWHDEGLAAILCDVGEAGELLRLIDQAFAVHWPQSLILPAREVVDALLKHPATTSEAKRLFRNTSTAGKLLTQLAATTDRIEDAGLSGVRRYRVNPPV